MTHDHTQDQPLETLSPEMFDEIYSRISNVIDSARAVKSEPEKIAEKIQPPKPRKKTFKQKILSLIGARNE
jgi:hypothetical protein